MRRTLCAAVIATAVLAAPAAPCAPVADSLVILLADGLGIGTLSAISHLAEAEGRPLRLESLPVTGLVRTAASDALVTDSAAAATALATGVRTRRGMVSVRPDGRPLPTLLERAAAAGLGAGVITTSGLLDATPAAFSTHALQRTDWAAIMAGLLASPVGLMIGGDWDIPQRASEDARAAAVMAALESAEAHGVTVARSADALWAAGEGRVMGFLPARAGSQDAHGPSLAESTRWALKRLGAGGRLVLLVETEETDEAGHANDLARMRAGLEELDAALGVALEWQREHPSTLVVVLSDHDTGGLSIIGDKQGFTPRYRWATDDHAAVWVPLFAVGPGASALSGVRDNDEVGRLLHELLGLGSGPAVSRVSAEPGYVPAG